MGALTEAEIFDCLETNFRLAAEDCEKLAKKQRGNVYARLREELRLIEGAAQQAKYWRQDARFTLIEAFAAKAAELSGGWLRGVKLPNGMYAKIPDGQRHPYFMRLAEILRGEHQKLKDLRDKKTGRVGLILPKVRTETRTEGRPIQVLLPDAMAKRESGLIVPRELTAQ